MKRFKTLDKGWKEILFAASGLEPNLLMILMGAFYTDAVNPSALGNASAVQSIAGVCLVVPALFPILFLIAKIFDGIIDVPLASLTDNLKTKWGKRRLPIIICFIPMLLTYAGLWYPIFGTGESAQLANTIWFTVMCFIFFGTYTMNLISFYGSIAQVTYDDNQRIRVSSYKAFFDTINYVVVYALVPLILTSIPIGKLVFLLLPMMATILIPVFLVKEGDKWEAKAKEMGYDISELKSASDENIGIIESIKGTMLNKPFLKWNLVNACTYFGLQMFLVSMNALIVGLMGLKTIHMTILNTCAFAPVPIMLYLFNKMKAKKGLRFTYQTCLLAFAICIFGFLVGSEYVMGVGNYTVKVIIGCVCGVAGSWAIGSFFMLPLLIPAQVSSVEEKLTGRNQSAMYFAGQALFTCVIGAIASSVYDLIKNYFVTKDFSQIVFAVSKLENGEIVEAREVAANALNLGVYDVYNLGTLLVPIIVSIFCVLGFFLAFKMCKNYSPREVAIELGLEKEYEANIDKFPKEEVKEVEEENLIVNIALWVLSGSIFAFIWTYGIINTTDRISKSKSNKWLWVASILLFPLAGIILYRTAKKIKAKCDELSIECKDHSVLSLVLSVLGLSIIPLIIQTIKLNKIAKVI